jgi:hypothetical protein
MKQLQHKIFGKIEVIGQSVSGLICLTEFGQTKILLSDIQYWNEEASAMSEFNSDMEKPLRIIQKKELEDIVGKLLGTPAADSQLSGVLRSIAGVGLNEVHANFFNRLHKLAIECDMCSLWRKASDCKYRSSGNYYICSDCEIEYNESIKQHESEEPHIFFQNHQFDKDLKRATHPAGTAHIKRQGEIEDTDREREIWGSIQKTTKEKK